MAKHCYHTTALATSTAFISTANTAVAACIRISAVFAAGVSAALHGVGLPTTCLAECENAAVVASQYLVQDRSRRPLVAEEEGVEE